MRILHSSDAVDAARARVRPWHLITALAVTLALVATVLAVVVADRASRIGDQLHHSNATLIAQQSDETAEASPTTALQMALAAYREKPDSPEAYGALLEQRLYWLGVDQVFQQVGELDDFQSSVDGRVVLTVPSDPDEDVTVWHDLTSAQPERLGIQVDSPSALSLSPDGRWLAEPHGSAVRLWDLAEGGAPRTLTNAGIPDVTAVDFSADGRFLAAHPVARGAGSAPVPVWETESGSPLPSGIRAEAGMNVTRAHPSGDGTALVMHEVFRGGQRTVVRDRASGQVRRSFAQGEILGFGAAVAACDNGVVTVRDTGTGDVRGQRSGVECPVRWDRSEQYLLLTDQGRTSENYTEAIHWPTWQRHVFSEPARQRALGASPALFADSDDSLTSLMTSDGTLRSNRLRTSEESSEVVTGSPRLTDRFPPRQRTVTYTDSGELAVLDQAGKTVRRTGVPGPVDAVSFDTTGKHVLTVAGGTLRIYDSSRLRIEHEKPLPGAGGLPRGNSAAAILPRASDEALVVHSGSLTYWNPRTGEQTSDRLPLNTGAGADVAATLRPEHSQVLVEHDGKLSLWDFKKRQRVHTFPSVRLQRAEPEFDSTGSIAAAVSATGDGIALFDLDRRVRLPGIDTEASEIHGIAGRYVFLENARGFQMWDWRQRKLVTSIRLGDGYREGQRDIVHHDRFDELVTDSTPGSREALTLEAENWYRGLCTLSDRAFTRGELRRLPEGVSTQPPCSGVL